MQWVFLLKHVACIVYDYRFLRIFIGLHYSRILVFLQLCLRMALYKSLLAVAEASVPMPETGNYSIGIQISVSNSSGAVVSGSFR